MDAVVGIRRRRGDAGCVDVKRGAVVVEIPLIRDDVARAVWIGRSAAIERDGIAFVDGVIRAGVGGGRRIGRRGGVQCVDVDRAGFRARGLVFRIGDEPRTVVERGGALAEQFERLIEIGGRRGVGNGRVERAGRRVENERLAGGELRWNKNWIAVAV